MRSGILIPITPIREPGWSTFSCFILADGAQAILAEDHPVPEDIARYLSRLQEQAPALIDAETFYVKQALLAYEAGLQPSAAVMLGCAAESLCSRLAAVWASRVPAGKRKQYVADLERSISIYWSNFREAADPDIKEIFPKERTAAKIALDNLYLVIKRGRDEGGHPQEFAIARDEVRSLLQMFPLCARSASRVLSWSPSP